MPIKFEKDPEGIVTLTFDAPGAPVNTMTEAWEKAFAATVERLAKEKASIKGVILASAKKTFFAGAELKDVLQVRPERRAEGVPLDRGREEAHARAGDAGHPGGRRAGRHRAGRRLGDRADGALPHRAGRSVASSSACPKSRWACCPARAASPRSRACSACRRRFPTSSKAGRCAAGRGEAGPRAGARREQGGPLPDGARVDRRQPGAEAALGRPEIPHARRRALQPAGVADAVDGAGDGGRENARPLPGAEGDHGGDGGRRLRRLRHGAAHRVALPRAPGRRAGGEEPDLALFQPHRDQVRRVAAQGHPEVEGDQGRHPRRRHDGRRHRLRERGARRGQRVEGCEPRGG